MKKGASVFAMLLFVVGLFAWALPVSAEVVDAGNKFCPVSGDKVSGKHFVEHGGKKYGLCCAMCAGKFEKNPEKYLAQMVAQETQGDAQADAHEHMDHAH